MSMLGIRQRLFSPFLPYSADMQVDEAIALKAPWNLLVLDKIKCVENRNINMDNKFYALYASHTWNKSLILEHLPDANDIDAARQLCGNIFGIAHFLSMTRLSTEEYNYVLRKQEEYFS